MNSTVSVVYYIILLIITELIKILIKSSLYFQLSLYFLQSFFFLFDQDSTKICDSKLQPFSVITLIRGNLCNKIERLSVST